MNTRNKEKHALVTGGAGFIGSHLVDALIARGYGVTVLDNLSTGKKENLAGVADKITFIEGSITDNATVERAMQGATLVFHQAAVASVPKSVEDPAGTYAVNVLGTRTVFTCAKNAGVRRVVYASSCAVYGNAPELPKHEDMEKAPASPYATHKSECEEAAELFYEKNVFEAIGLRYFNVFGPRQDASSPYSGVISIFLNRLCTGDEITIFGDGKTTRDFIYVSDVVDANIRAGEIRETAKNIFNVGTGKETSLNTVVQTLGALLRVVPDVVYKAERAGDVRRSVADISLIQKELGWTSSVSFEAGLQNIVRV